MDLVIKVGDLIRLKEQDYCYGVGDLVLRVTAISSPLGDSAWRDVTGVEIAWNGHHSGERTVRVRLTALQNPKTRSMP